ncbi:MAG: hypothetical protein PHE03_11255 [Bacteroidales bacterium]|nr:hypothetical protein [Bacteroidales bacterium]
MHLKKITTTIFYFFIHGKILVMTTCAAGFFVNDTFDSSVAICFQALEFNADTQNPTSSDKLMLMSGEDMICEVKRVSDKFVFYTKLGGKDMEWIDRRLVKTIYYQNGVVDDLTKKETIEKSPRDWKEVTITKKPEDIAGMVKVSDISIKHVASTRQHYFKSNTLESSAEIVARRNAAQKDADFVLVLKVEHHRPYGDPPVVTIIGEAYKKQ